MTPAIDADPGPGDPTGLQAERTQLAWARTALATGALAAVASRLAGDRPSLVLAIGLGLVVALPGAVAALLRIRALQRQHLPRGARRSMVGLLVSSVVLADVAALALLVT